ncbi:MAG: methyltransferase domain-containing protein [bacterium]
MIQNFFSKLKNFSKSTNSITPEYTSDYQEGIRQFAIDGANKIIPILIEEFHPASVLDVGCGTAEWVAKAASLGVEDFMAIDMEYATATLAIPKDHFKVVNLNNGFDLKRKFDLILNIEVAEHLQPENADRFIDSLVKHSDQILFSAALPVKNEFHVNEQYWEYWIEKFAQRGYLVIDMIRPNIWDEPKVAAAYKSDMLVFLKVNLPRAQELAKQYPFKNIIHPELFGCVMQKFYKGKTF